MEESQFISGIYNWCDRWCERCSFTSRCRVFEREETRKSTNPNQEVWDSISENFRETIELLQKTADEMGISLEISEEEKQQITATENELDEIAQKHPLTQLADEYLNEGKDWLESDAAKDYLAQLQIYVELGTVSEEEGKRKVESLEEYLEVIHWYLFFIAVKIQRAIRDQGESFWNDFSDEERGDLGTAKIAAIAIERSLGAWAGIYKMMPEEDRVLLLLAKLDKMRKLLKEVFPKYPKFIRPGFDEN